MQDHPSRRAPRRARRALGAIALVAVLASTLPASATPYEGDAAAGWLVAQHDAGQVTTSGALADLIFALVGIGTSPETVATALGELEEAITGYLAAGGSDAGTMAKALLGIQVAGGDGTDLEARVRDLSRSDGPDAGRFGDAIPFAQSLAVIALSRTDAGAPSESVRWLADQRCPDGGFEAAASTTGCTAAGAGDVDTTAVAIQALTDQAAATDERDAAAAWLVGQQADDGSFADNANSTGLAGQTLRAVGDAAAADRAAEFVASLQIPAGEPDAGAIRYRADDDGSLYLATTQGVLAFGAPALPDLRAQDDGTNGSSALIPTGEGCTGDEGVTVVVDLTFFDAGVLQSCAYGDPATGLDALREAAFDVITQTADFGEYVCAIEGLPELACDQPFEGQYWAYSAGAEDGSWTAQQVGADAYDPEPGDVEGWRYGEGDGPTIPATGTAVRRLAGQDRISTAVAVSRATFAGAAAGGAVLARADDFADALAGTPLASAVGGPLLITPSGSLADAVADELQRVLPAGATVHVLGGTAAIDEAVVTELEELGYVVDRLAGDDRITTAIAVARELGDPTDLLITTGYGFADALAAGSAAAATADAAVLLTTSDTPHPALDEYLATREAAQVYAIGGPAASAYPEAIAVAGDTREATAVAVAETFFPEPTTVGIARRDEFADALAGGPHIAQLGGPLLLTPSDALAAEVQAYLCRTDSVAQAVLYGGEAAVTDRVGGLVGDALAGATCG